VNDHENSSTVDKVITIAGDFVHNGKDGDMNAYYERLKTSSSSEDSKKEGLRAILHGGKYPWEGKNSKKQEAIIEFICDRDRTGLEGLTEGCSGKGCSDESSKLRKRNPDDDDDDDDDKDDDDVDSPKNVTAPSLKILTYKEDDGGLGILRMEWKTKYACEDSKNDPDRVETQHWGFFTWLLMM
jgi:autophagy-related protein 27